MRGERCGGVLGSARRVADGGASAVHFIRHAVEVRDDGREDIEEPVGGDDAAGTPDLEAGAEGDAPALLLALPRNELEALRKGSERGRKDGRVDVLDELRLLGCGKGCARRDKRRRQLQGLADLEACRAVGGGQAEKVRGCDRGRRDVDTSCLCYGPGAGAFGVVGILDDFVDDGRENMVFVVGYTSLSERRVALLADVGADVDQECLFLR